MKQLVILMIVAIFFSSCGKEIGRVDFNGISTKGGSFNGKSPFYPLATKETIINLHKGKDLSFWTELNIKYKNDIQLGFNCEFLSGDSIIGEGGYDPMDVNPKMKSIETQIGEFSTKQYEGKMTGFFKPTVDQKLKIRVTLVTSENNTLEINKLAFVIKE